MWNDETKKAFILDISQKGENNKKDTYSKRKRE